MDFSHSATATYFDHAEQLSDNNFRNKENTKCVSYMFYHFDKAEPAERHVVTGVDHHHSPTQLKKQVEAKSG